MTASLRPCCSVRIRLRRVVLPAPRKPVRTVTGMGASAAEGELMRTVNFARDGAVSTRGRLGQVEREEVMLTSKRRVTPPHRVSHPASDTPMAQNHFFFFR